MFSYAVAVRDVWAFHWHNISGRTSVFLLSLLAAEALVGIRGNPWVGIITYGLLFYISPFVGLILTYMADRSPGNTIFVYACTSTAMLCPLIFGFPTEMWLAHAIFWLVLALSHYARPTVAPSMLVFVAQLHYWPLRTKALWCCCWLLWRHWPHVACEALHSTAATCLIIILIMATISKIAFPPDDYYAKSSR